MPELPEVETIVRSLRDGGRSGPSILERTISKSSLFWGRTLAEPKSEEFSERICGQTIQSVSRRAKFLVLTLSIDILLIHLRMSGDIRVEPAEAASLPHDRLHLLFTNDERLVFNDPRKFGRVWLVRDSTSVLGGLGPEPFAKELTEDEFFHKLQATRRQIKPLLLDQKFLAGMGNIYSDEALHRAGLHPMRPADQIDRGSAGRLLAAIRETLEEGVRRNGASIDWVYRGGDFQNHFRVYQRTGEPCEVCGAVVERKVIGQRSTHFCPVCQPAIESTLRFTDEIHEMKPKRKNLL